MRKLLKKNQRKSQDACLNKNDNTFIKNQVLVNQDFNEEKKKKERKKKIIIIIIIIIMTNK